METSAQNTGEQKVSTRLLLACGAIAPLLNIVVILILGATRPGYNAWQIPDSNLELGEGGWIQIANYIVTGISVPDPVLGYPPGASSAPTVYGTLHNLFGQLQFISLIAACFVLARRDAADPARRGWVWYSLATGLLIAASDVAFVLTFKLWDGGPVGLIERIGIIGGGIWIALLAIRLMSKKVSIA